MRKISLFILLSLSLLISFISCTLPPVETPNDDSAEMDEACSLLNALSCKEYETVTVEIKTTTAFAQLSSKYVISDNEVSYSIEQLNTLSAEGEFSELSPDFKTVFTGSAVVEGGEIIELDGNSVDLPSYSELKGRFNFDKDNFDKVSLEKNSFSADVISPSAFYGTDVDVSDLSICVEYTNDALISLSISYKTDNATVNTVYSFE